MQNETFVIIYKNTCCLLYVHTFIQTMQSFQNGKTYKIITIELSVGKNVTMLNKLTLYEESAVT